MKKLLTPLAIGAAALFNVAAAHAAVMDFDTNVDYTYAPFAGYGGLLASGDAVVQGNYFAQVSDSAGDVDPSILAGNVSNASTPSSCLGACPSNGASYGNFLSTYDDSQVHFGKLDGGTLAINSLAAAFITAPSAPANSTIYLAVEADSGANYIAYGWLLNTSGAFQTINTSTGGTKLYASGTPGSFTQGVTDYYVFGYYCPAGVNCVAFRSDLAQFAIDNVTFDVSAVPEPSEWMLMVLGLGAIGAARRRRSI